jgi:hypothetical protein
MVEALASGETLVIIEKMDSRAKLNDFLGPGKALVTPLQ